MIEVRIDKLVPREWYDSDKSYNNDSVKDMKSWCGKNCRGQWEYTIYYDVLLWTFKIEEDAVAFKLRWA